MSSVFRGLSKSQAAPAAHVEGEWTHGRRPSGHGGTHAQDASPSAVRALASWLVGAAAPPPVVVAPPAVDTIPRVRDEERAPSVGVGHTVTPPIAAPREEERESDTSDPNP